MQYQETIIKFIFALFVFNFVISFIAAWTTMFFYWGEKEMRKEVKSALIKSNIFVLPLTLCLALAFALS